MKKVLFIFALAFIVLNPLFAEKIIFSANSMSGKAGDTNTSTKLTGNAYVKTETMEIMADELELFGEDYQNIKASGNVSGKNLETHMDFNCDSLEFDRKSKIALLQGNVTLKDTDNEVEADAQIIEYDQNTEIAILQIGISLKQKNNVCSSSYAVYYKNEQMLELSGNAQVKQDDDTFRAQFITFDMDTQDITLGGNVKGSVTDRKETKSEQSQDVDASKDTEESMDSDEEKTETESEVISEEKE
ncbi:MAG: organic solvent tolerance protein OstA [Treponema sp.]|nr:organic solvent tolerance protein OstA [Treponema sp.]